MRATPLKEENVKFQIRSTSSSVILSAGAIVELGGYRRFVSGNLLGVLDGAAQYFST